MIPSTVLAISQADDLYIGIVFLHILCVIVGFGSTSVWPPLAVKAKKSVDPSLMAKVSEMGLDGRRMVTDPFI